MSTKISLFFDPAIHKYTDNCNNEYISVTTLIGQYSKKFDTKKIARLCELSGRKGNPKYKGKTAKMLEKEWEKTKEVACENGNIKHNYLEDAVKQSTGYRIGTGNLLSNGRLLTVADVIEHPGFGELSIDYFIATKIHILYPSIFTIISKLVEQGYRIYAELGVFDDKRLISGLIDLFLIKGKEFIVIDWKTNREDISYEAGYWEKDVKGNSTTNFIRTYETFKEPLDNLPCSVGYKYALQTNTYGVLSENFGLHCKAIILCHIRHEQYLDNNSNTLIDKVDFLSIPFMRNEVNLMINHYHNNRRLNHQMEITL